MLARFPRKYTTHTSTLPTPSMQARVARDFSNWLKSFLKKNSRFRNIDLYFDQKIIIIKRHLQVMLQAIQNLGNVHGCHHGHNCI